MSTTGNKHRTVCTSYNGCSSAYLASNSFAYRYGHLCVCVCVCVCVCESERRSCTGNTYSTWECSLQSSASH